MTKRQPELMNEWGTRFHGRAKNDGGDVWWYEEPLSDGTVRRHPLMPVTPRADGEQPPEGASCT